MTAEALERMESDAIEIARSRFERMRVTGGTLTGLELLRSDLRKATIPPERIGAAAHEIEGLIHRAAMHEAQYLLSRIRREGMSADVGLKFFDAMDRGAVEPSEVHLTEAEVESMRERLRESLRGPTRPR